MQNFIPDALRLNNFQHVEIPDNSKLFLRVQGKSIPTGNPDVQQADFFSRKTEQYVREEQQFLQDYQAYQNKLDKESEYSKSVEKSDKESDYIQSVDDSNYQK